MPILFDSMPFPNAVVPKAPAPGQGSIAPMTKLPEYAIPSAKPSPGGTYHIPGIPRLPPASAWMTYRTPEGQTMLKPWESAKPKPNDWIVNLYNTTRQMTDEDREAFLMDQRGRILERLARWEYRLSRGLKLTPAQQAQYQSLRTALADIDKFMRDPSDVIEYVETGGASAESRVPIYAASINPIYPIPETENMPGGRPPGRVPFIGVR